MYEQQKIEESTFKEDVVKITGRIMRVNTAG
jgi:hypothetical protein